MCMLKYVCVCVCVFDERWHVGRGGCVASSLRWSLGVLLVWIVWRGDRRNCVWPPKPSWPDTKHEKAVALYTHVCCVYVKVRARGAEAVKQRWGEKRQCEWVCVGKQKREISSYTCRTMSCVFVRTSSCMTVYWLCKAITARSDRVDTHRVIVRESCGFHLIPESQINKLKSCPIRTRSNKLHRYLRRWVCLPAHQSTHHKGIHTHMDTS